MDPVLDPGSPVQKPGIKTTEFWLSTAATLLGLLFASGAVTSNAALQVMGLAASLLTALGYQVSRGFVKSSGNKAAAQVESAKALAASSLSKS